MWSTTLDSSGGFDPARFNPKDGFKTKNDCMAVAREADRLEKAQTGSVTFHRICLPETMDPLRPTSK